MLDKTEINDFLKFLSENYTLSEESINELSKAFDDYPTFYSTLYIHFNFNNTGGKLRPYPLHTWRYLQQFIKTFNVTLGFSHCKTNKYVSISFVKCGIYQSYADKIILKCEVDSINHKLHKPQK